MATEIRVPTLGESVTEATVATWFKKPGDRVMVDEMLCELETDKVTVEVPSPVAGVLAEIVAPEGTTVGVNARWRRSAKAMRQRPQNRRR
ncbi:MAG: biotin/lipoyl-containing protein [Paracoccaceae bacterium]